MLVDGLPLFEMEFLCSSIHFKYFLSVNIWNRTVTSGKCNHNKFKYIEYLVILRFLKLRTESTRIRVDPIRTRPGICIYPIELLDRKIERTKI